MKTEIESLGDCRFESPLRIPQFIKDGAKVLVDVELKTAQELADSPAFDNAGPRRKIFFDPPNTTAAIVTCGGLCPGLNNVIQSLVRMLLQQYGIKNVLGVPYGFEGLIPEYGHSFIPLNAEAVDSIHQTGGSILGSSRGPQDCARMVDTLVKNNISMLFAIGGDGTLRGAEMLHQEIKKRGLPIAIAAIPKTIDNDIRFAHKTFGFATAVSVATGVIHAAHAEAKSAKNGIGLVKVMGRDSGYIAAYVALASNEVNVALIPEVEFALEGTGGLLPYLEERLKKKGHAVILVAEGAGQKYAQASGEKDASGNTKHGDIGLFLKNRIEEYLKERKFPSTLKYIDPSYIIRSVPASAEDAVFCIMLAQNAVHGAMCGKTGFVVGYWNSYYTYVPLVLATEKRKKVDPSGYLWTMVKEATGQPDFWPFDNVIT
ncbi:MAG: ATP-dependent 6-phosphofructokinase [Spirochaetia bacterium]|nr:ATP-dependent 6-phosphofructokinase [Spirochaetia bacterium]